MCRRNPHKASKGRRSKRSRRGGPVSPKGGHGIAGSGRGAPVSGGHAPNHARNPVTCHSPLGSGPPAGG